MKKYNRIITETPVDSELEFYENEESTDESLAEEETNGPETRYGVITSSISLFVRARSNPSRDAAVVGLLQRGEEVTIMDKINGFYKIATPNIIAYVLSEFVQEEE